MSDDLFSSDQSASESGTDAPSEQSIGVEDLLAAVTREDGSRKYNTPQELLKGYQESQAYIKKLQEEHQQFRSELDKRLSAEAVLEQIKAQAKPDEKPSTEFDPEAIRDVVHKELEAKTQQEKMQYNLRQFSDQLSAIYGDKAKEAVATKARELGVSVDRVKEIAAESATAALAMFGVASNKPDGIPRKPSGSVSTESLGVGGERNYAYYQKLRRDNPAEYKKVYMQMFRDAERNPNFYK